MKKTYYNEILIDIRNLINSKKYNEAYKKLENELNIPYIPIEYEKKMKDIFFELKPLIKRNKNFIFNDIDFIKKQLLKPKNEEIKYLILEKLKEFNINNLLNEIKILFLSNTFSDYLKTKILFILKSQKINIDFKIKKKFENFVINPQNCIDFFENNDVNDILKYLEDRIYSENPSLFEVCISILERFYYFLYPNFCKEYDSIDLANAIIISAYKMQFINLDNELINITNNKNIRYIFSIIKNYNFF